MRDRLERYILGRFDRSSDSTIRRGKEMPDTTNTRTHGEANVESSSDDADGAAMNSVEDVHAPESTDRHREPTVTERQQTQVDYREPRLEFTSRCHVGKVRPRNEDACFSFLSQSGGTEPLPLFGLFIVADGMGGHNDGHRASKLVARTVAQHILERLYRSLLHEGHSAMQQPVQEAMEQAVMQANQALAGAETGKEMGTTLTAAIILGSRLFLVHIGDSRAYLLHDEKLSLVTTDHTFVQALQDAGQLTAEEAAIHPNRNLLYRALMGEPMEEPIDVFTRALPPHGTLMLCSDGLWGAVEETTIAAILNRPDDLQAKADRLLHEALNAGGDDNITVILVSFKF